VNYPQGYGADKISYLSNRIDFRLSLLYFDCCLYRPTQAEDAMVVVGNVVAVVGKVANVGSVDAVALVIVVTIVVPILSPPFFQYTTRNSSITHKQLPTTSSLWVILKVPTTYSQLSYL
jgi:hypothetical protein